MPILEFMTVFAAESASHGAEAAEHSAEESAGIAALGLDPLAILAQTGTFLVLFWVVKKFALDKISKTLEERRQTIDKGVRLGVKMEAEEAKLQERVEEQLKKARGESDKIIVEAQRESGEIIKAAQDQAAAKTDQMITDAHAKIDEDMACARKELEKDIRVLVADATEVILEEKLDARKDESLIRRALSSVGVSK